jgi:hypothetical protein
MIENRIVRCALCGAVFFGLFAAHLADAHPALAGSTLVDAGMPSNEDDGHSHDEQNPEPPAVLIEIVATSSATVSAPVRVFRVIYPR